MVKYKRIVLQITGDQLDQMEVVKETPNVGKCVHTHIDNSAFDAIESELKDMRTNTETLKEKLKTSSPFSIPTFEGNDEK
ncbi:hypothetical protein MAR_002597 [Mya arenaria]|uniref:Uncharacterized protein n=1 Tax=Mya arenaria TaxID=6604 RepID=A0ABY7G6P8_MYAAR|nr:hypothetical protein MAR_002597 [Mya arenaria]